MYPILFLKSLIPSPSRLLLFFDIMLVFRNVVLQMLDFLLQLPNLLLNPGLMAVRGAFAWCFSLLIDSATAAMEWATVVVKVRVETSLPGAGRRAGEEQGRGLGFAAAIKDEDIVETHGSCWVFWRGLKWWRIC